MVIYLLGGMRLPICLGESRMGNKVINLVSREGSHQSFQKVLMRGGHQFLKQKIMISQKFHWILQSQIEMFFHKSWDKMFISIMIHNGFHKKCCLFLFDSNFLYLSIFIFCCCHFFKFSNFFFQMLLVFNSPGQRPCELLP